MAIVKLSDSLLNSMNEVNTTATNTTNIIVGAATSAADTLEKIEGLINNINLVLASDDTSLDNMQEIVDAIKVNAADIVTLTNGKLSAADIINNLTSTDTDKPLSANQGKVLKDIADQLNTDLTNHTHPDLALVRENAFDRNCSGLVSGGAISASVTSGYIDVAIGIGYINDHSFDANSFKRISFSGGSVNNIGNGANYIAINSSGQITASLTQQNIATHIYLGHVYVAGGQVLEVFNVPEWASHYSGRVNEWMAHAFGVLVADGLTVSEKASPNELQLTISAGEFYARLGEYDVSETSTFSKMYNTADYGWYGDTNNANTVNITQYNNPSFVQTAALVTMTAGYWKKDLLLVTPAGNVYYIYGQTEFATEDEASTGPLPTIPDAIAEDTAKIAAIISQKDSTSVADGLIDIRPIMDRVFGFGTEGASGTVVDHGTLTGLSDDDHPQYQLAVDKGEANGFASLDADAKVPLDEIREELKFALATGIIERGVLSINADPTKFDITAGQSLYVDYSDPNDVVVDTLAWDTQTLTPPSLNTNGRLWVGISRTAPGVGTIVYSQAFTPLERRTIAIVGRVWGNGTTTIEGVGQYATPAFGTEKTLEDLMYAIGSINLTGNVFYPHGADLEMAKTSGSSFRFSAAAGTNIISPNLHTDAQQVQIQQYHYIFQDSETTTLKTVVNAEQWDNNGTLTAVPTDNWTVQRIYFFPASGVVDVMYGQAVYPTFSEALVGVTAEVRKISAPTERLLFGSILRGMLVVKQGETSLLSADTRFVASPSLAGGGAGHSLVQSFPHGELTELNHDDHSQYHTDARGDARYSVLAHDHSGVYDPIGSGSSAVSTHESNWNHDNFLVTKADVEGVLTGEISTHSHEDIDIVKQVLYGTVPAAAGTSNIPADTSIPTSGEGTQIWSRSITPQASGNKINIEAAFQASYANGNQDTGACVSLFRNTTNIGTIRIGPDRGEWSLPCSFNVMDAPNTTSSVTYSMRIGRLENFGTWYVGRNLDNYFGTSQTKSGYTLTELEI